MHERKFVMSHRCGVRRIVTHRLRGLADFSSPRGRFCPEFRFSVTFGVRPHLVPGVSLGRPNQDSGTCFSFPTRAEPQERQAPFSGCIRVRRYPGFVRLRRGRQLGKSRLGNYECGSRGRLLLNSLGSDSFDPALHFSSARNRNVLRHLEWLAPSQSNRIPLAKGSSHEAPEMGGCSWTVLSRRVLVSDHCGSLRPSENASSLRLFRRTLRQL